MGLDPKQIIEIRELIKELGKEHTVILSSHILSEVRSVCDRLLIIAKGKLVADDTPEACEEKLSDWDLHGRNDSGCSRITGCGQSVRFGTSDQIHKLRYDDGTWIRPDPQTSTIEILTGDYNDASGEYYARLAGDDSVYLVTDEYLEYFECTTDDLAAADDEEE